MATITCPTGPLAGATRAADVREAERLLADYARSRSGETRAAIIRQFEPLARSLARRFRRPGVPLEDLFQVALVGLVKAVDRFDPAAGFLFITFARPTIAGELRHYLRDHAWVLHVPRSMQELAGRVQRVEPELAERLGRKATAREVAAHLELAEEQVLEAQALLENHRRRSPGDFADCLEEDGVPAVEDRVGEEDAGLRRAEDRVGLRQAMRHLEPPLRRILQLRYLEDPSQRAVAAELGISAMQVCRLERQALAQLRRQFAAA